MEFNAISRVTGSYQLYEVDLTFMTGEERSTQTGLNKRVKNI